MALVLSLPVLYWFFLLSPCLCHAVATFDIEKYQLMNISRIQIGRL